MVDAKLREQIIEEYMPLVKHIASRVSLGINNQILEFDDLVSFGVIGLMDAISKFDEHKGNKFSTYASIRIKGAIIDEIRKNSPISKVAMTKLAKYNKKVEELQKKLLREPTDKEIAFEMGISIAEVNEIENYINYLSIVSLEEIIFQDDSDMTVISTIEDKNSPDPQESFEIKEKIEYLSKAIDLLNEKDRLVLNLYYYEKLTLKQIGSILDVSESRVSQLHSKAIMNLRKTLKNLKYI